MTSIARFYFSENASIHFSSKLKEFIEQQKISKMFQVFNLYLQNEFSKAKVELYKNVSGLREPTVTDTYVDLYGSEAQQFFEPLIKSPFAKIEVTHSCSNQKCC